MAAICRPTRPVRLLRGYRDRQRWAGRRDADLTIAAVGRRAPGL